jgi:hypothetical protein
VSTVVIDSQMHMRHPVSIHMVNVVGGDSVTCVDDALQKMCYTVFSLCRPMPASNPKYKNRTG